MASTEKKGLSGGYVTKKDATVFRTIMEKRSIMMK